jgi:hypothetical protein
MVCLKHCHRQMFAMKIAYPEKWFYKICPGTCEIEAAGRKQAPPTRGEGSALEILEANMASTKANAAATECSTFAGGCCLSVGRGKECKYIHLGEPGEIECTISVKKYCTAKCLYKHGGGASDFLLGNVPAGDTTPPASIHEAMAD